MYYGSLINIFSRMFNALIEEEDEHVIWWCWFTTAPPFSLQRRSY